MTRTRTQQLIAAIAALAFGLTACDAGTGSDSAPTPRATADPQVVSFDGLSEIRFGDRRADLAQDHGLSQGPTDCMPQLPSYPSVSAVFAADELVLLWVDPPLHTPEGLAVGSAVQAVRAAHPDAEELRAPPDSYQFDGLLAVRDDRGYLFLHDGHTVQKLIVGYEQHARLLLQTHQGTC